MSSIRILRAQFEAEELMAWQALNIPPTQPAAQAAAGRGTPSLPAAQAPGTPASPGNDGIDLPIAPFPTPPVYPGDDGIDLPIAPAPTPPAYPGPSQVRTGWVRFLHAATGYDPLRILVHSRLFTPSLSYANMTEYRLVQDGYHDVVITPATGARPILLRKTIPFRAGDQVTLAIIDTDMGLDLLQVPDIPCQNPMGGCGSLRMVNLSFNSPPLDMRLYDGGIVLSDVRYREITPFKPFRCGDYLFYLIRTSPVAGSSGDPGSVPYEPLVSFGIHIKPHATYTCYVIGHIGVPGQVLQLLVAEDE